MFTGETTSEWFNEHPKLYRKGSSSPRLELFKQLKLKKEVGQLIGLKLFRSAIQNFSTSTKNANYKSRGVGSHRFA